MKESEEEEESRARLCGRGAFEEAGAGLDGWDEEIRRLGVDFESVGFEAVVLEDTLVKGSLAGAGDVLLGLELESLSTPVTEGYCLPFFLHKSF